uniref:Uncharacterized protein n=1 Tax=Peromyscus maniculatus bairdii TaxID=230844 RepID=A0A8C8UIM0_PERMB
MKREDTGGETEVTRQRQRQRQRDREREKKQIERHILRTGQAREFKNKTWRQTRLLCQITLPKTVPEKTIILKAERRQVKERELLPIKGHQECVIQGRELLEQRLKERVLRKSQSQIPPQFEKVVAYPLFQTSRTSPIKVDLLREKSPDEEKVSTIIKPYGKRFLAVPPFLRTQIGKIKDQ